MRPLIATLLVLSCVCQAGQAAAPLPLNSLCTACELISEMLTQDMTAYLQSGAAKAVSVEALTARAEKVLQMCVDGRWDGYPANAIRGCRQLVASKKDDFVNAFLGLGSSPELKHAYWMKNHICVEAEKVCPPAKVAQVPGVSPKCQGCLAVVDNLELQLARQYPFARSQGSFPEDSVRNRVGDICDELAMHHEPPTSALERQCGELLSGYRPQLEELFMLPDEEESSRGIRFCTEVASACSAAEVSAQVAAAGGLVERREEWFQQELRRREQLAYEERERNRAARQAEEQRMAEEEAERSKLEATAAAQKAAAAQRAQMEREEAAMREREKLAAEQAAAAERAFRREEY
eukprot:jgi/Mesvir1/27939/Mv20153-RA.2